MDVQTATDLAATLRRLDEAEKALLAAPDGEVAAAAMEYMTARAEAAPRFQAAQAGYEAELAAAGESPPGTPPDPAAGLGPDAPAPAAEASPGVALVQPPGVAVSAENLKTFGVLAFYRPTPEDPDKPLIEATTYAFAAGTAIDTGGDTPVGTTQPSRVVLGEEGELGVVTNDVFVSTYEKADPAPSDPVPAEEPASETPAAPEEPASAADDGEAGDS